MFFFLVLMLVLSNAIWFDAFSSKPISKRLSPVQTSFRRFLGVKPAGSINHAVRQNVNSDDGYGYDYYDEWEEVVMPSVEYDGTEEWYVVMEFGTGLKPIANFHAGKRLKWKQWNQSISGSKRRPLCRKQLPTKPRTLGRWMGFGHLKNQRYVYNYLSYRSRQN